MNYMILCGTILLFFHRCMHSLLVQVKLSHTGGIQKQWYLKPAAIETVKFSLSSVLILNAYFQSRQ